MAKTAAQSADSGIEYSVHTFAKDESGKDRVQVQGVTNDMEKALKAAENLCDSGQFSKVEVKQKYFDKKNNRNIDMTLKVFAYKKKSGALAIVGFLALALAGGGAAFAAAYFLTRGG
jgi:hypothetical protein